MHIVEFYKSSTMKKVIIIVLALVVGFAFESHAQILYRISGNGLEAPS